MSYPSFFWHDVVCVQIAPSQEQKDPDCFTRTLLIRGRTWNGDPETFRIELFGPEEIQVLQGGTAQELEQAADELLYPKRQNPE